MLFIVIDFCLTKILVTDPNTNLACLKSEWASRNSLIQRAGRVGRVSDGRVYRLITEQFFYVRKFRILIFINFLCLCCF